MLALLTVKTQIGSTYTNLMVFDSRKSQQDRRQQNQEQKMSRCIKIQMRGSSSIASEAAAGHV
jgi:hypothetical protein